MSCASVALPARSPWSTISAKTATELPSAEAGVESCLSSFRSLVSAAGEAAAGKCAGRLCDGTTAELLHHGSRSFIGWHACGKQSIVPGHRQISHSATLTRHPRARRPQDSGCSLSKQAHAHRAIDSTSKSARPKPSCRTLQIQRLLSFLTVPESNCTSAAAM